MCNRRQSLTRLLVTLALLATFLSVARISTWAAGAINGQSQAAIAWANRPALKPTQEYGTTTTLSGPSGTFTTQQATTFTATVEGVLTASKAKTTSVAQPTGTVTFLDNGVNIPGCVNIALVNQIATCTVTLAKGTHVITAVYGGDTTYFGSTSGNSLTLRFTLDPAEVPEADSLILFGSGASGVTAWLGWQWKKLKRRSK
jgi:hypothetical protein